MDYLVVIWIKKVREKSGEKMKRNQGSGVSKFPKMPLGVRNEPQNTAKYQKNHPGLAKLPPGPRMTNLLRDDDSMSIGVKRFV